jgi:hypothetical protein
MADMMTHTTAKSFNIVSSAAVQLERDTVEKKRHALAWMREFFHPQPNQ